MAGETVRIIIPCHGDASTINECLEHVIRSKCHGAFTVVVVNDQPGADLNYLSTKFGVQIRQSTNPGSAARARNLGAADAHEDILVFIDADVMVEPGAITALIEPIITHQADAAVGNYSSAIAGLDFLQAYKQLYIHHVYSRKRGAITAEFWTALGAVSRSAFILIGGFDEQYCGAGGEDTDLGLRLSAKSFRIMAVPHAAGIHKRSLSLPKLVMNDFRKGVLTIFNSWVKHNPLRNNRHASRADVSAVALAGVAALAMLMGLLLLSPSWLYTGLLTLVLYVLSRLQLLRIFFERGTLFGLTSLVLQFTLDIVRGLSVITGTLKALLTLQQQQHQAS